MDASGKSLASATALTILAAGCGAAGDADSPGEWYDPPPLAWEACEDAEGPYAAEMECAALAVPVDWSDREGEEITLDVARLPATDPENRRGVVIVVSGGPGGSGIADLADAADGLAEVRERFDLVAHEPRTYRAQRTLPDSCREMPGVALVLPEDEADYERILRPLVEGVERCRADDESGLVDHLDGLSQAVDVEAIRRALGEEVVSFTAQSYGGVVVATYARHFPERVRAAFVDGSPSHPDAPYSRDSGLAERNFGRFADWCEAEPDCALYGEDVRRVWRELTERANRSPVPATSERYGEVELSGVHIQFLTPGWAAPGEDYARWLRLAEDIDRARDGDASAFADFALANLDAWGRAVWIAMYCSDGRSASPGYREFMELIDRRRRAAPHTYGRALMGIVCGAWTIPVANPPAPLPGDELPPFLGAGTADNDLAGVEQFLEHIPGSVAIAVEGAGHVVYLPGLDRPANRCVLEHVRRYLIDLELPTEGVRCAAEPSDDATVAAASA